MKSKKPILLVEDDEIDVMSVKRSLRDLAVSNRLEVTGNGEEAVEFLNQPRNDLPCIILLKGVKTKIS